MQHSEEHRAFHCEVMPALARQTCDHVLAASLLPQPLEQQGGTDAAHSDRRSRLRSESAANFIGMCMSALPPARTGRLLFALRAEKHLAPKIGMPSVMDFQLLTDMGRTNG